MTVCINGKYYSKAEAKISVFDHGLLYGDGVFEGIRVYKGKAFLLPEHLKRLYQSAQAITLEIPYDNETLTKMVQETIKEAGKEEGYIRLLVTRGTGNLGMDPKSCETPNVIIILDDIQLYPREYYQDGIKVITASTRRIPVDSLDARIKSLNYLNNVMAKIEAINANCMEAIMLNQDGFVSECTGDNIFLIKDGVLQTPSSKSNALDGITKNLMIALAKEANIQVEEKSIAQYDLYIADEVFLTGTGAEIMPVTEVDGRKIGTGVPGTKCLELIEAFKAKTAL
jgi:branched-chain amino acid aminotransferase